MSRMKPRHIALALALIAVIIVGVWGALRARRALEAARELRADVGALKRELDAVDGPEDLPAALEAGRAGLAEVQTSYAALRGEVGPFAPLLRGLGWLPAYGDDLAAVPHLLDLTGALLEAARSLDVGLSPLAALLEGPAGNLPLEAATRAIQAQPHIGQAQQAAAAARAAREAIGDPSGLRPELQSAVEDADQALELLERGLAVSGTYFPALSPLLGMDGPHHVLVLVQNADELRPTGGWISATVYVTLEGGAVSQAEVLNSHDLAIDRFGELSYGTPPQPLRDYMQLPIWAFRDANWSPDFPTSATRALELYTAGRGVLVDTVVTINQFTLRDFLAAVGPVTLADRSEVDQASVITFLQDAWAESYKDILPELAPLLLERLLDVQSAGDALVRWEALSRSAARGDLLLYSTRPQVQAAVEGLGWDGALAAGPGDFLYPVEANVGYNKVNLNITRELRYHVSLQALERPYGEISLVFDNRSQGTPGTCSDRQGGDRVYTDRAHDCYGNYLRLYLADGTTVSEPPGFPVLAGYRFVDDPAAGQFAPLPDERGREVYGGLLVVPIGERLEASFTTLLEPEAVLAAQPDGALVYRLRVPKHPGVPPYPLQVTVDLPPGAEVVSVSPEPTYAAGGTVHFERTLDSDFELELLMEVGEVPAGLPLDATPAVSPTPRVLPTGAPLPTVPPELRAAP